MEHATANTNNKCRPESSGLRPKFSIVTSTLNAASTLPLTARSLMEQTFCDFEWIVIDAASKDGTVEVARSFGSLVTTLVCEPDNGIYEAWNKALPRVRGHWVLFLGAGDTLYAPDVLDKISTEIEILPPNKTTLYGNVIETNPVDSSERVRDQAFQGLDGPWGGGRPRLPSHQGVFQHASVFEGFYFDQRCQISADNEILLRELLADRGVKLDMMVARYLKGGISTQPNNRLRMVSESIYINWKLGIFQKRPIYQLAVLVLNAAAHPFRHRD